MDAPAYAPASLAAARSLPSRLVESSVDAGWTSALVERRRTEPPGHTFEAPPTPDLTLVVALDGTHQLASFEHGRWRGVTHGPGAAGMKAGGETRQLRSVVGVALDTGHLYVPHQVLAEAADTLRRAGQRTAAQDLSALVFVDPVVPGAVRALLEAARLGAPDLYAEQAVCWLATHLLTTRGAADPRRRDPGGERLSDARLSRTIAFIRARYADPLSLDALAGEACVSKFHFARLFRARTGMSPHAFLVDTRMAAARGLLRETDLPVADVARRSGYARPVHFGVAFKRRHGVTPTAYRRRRAGAPASGRA